MALDHSRLGQENKFLETNQAEFFAFDNFSCIKSCQQIWGRVHQPFILFTHHILGETVLWGAVFIIQTSDRMQYFTNGAIQNRISDFDKRRISQPKTQ